jgi:dTDP-glucose 4,6-dehydratase
MKKILITGGSGFIGTNFIEKLNKKKFKICNLDKISSESTPEKFKQLINRKNYKFCKIDLINNKKMRDIITKFKPDTLINFAAESHVDRSIDSPYKFLKNNFISAVNIFTIFKDYSKSNKSSNLIHISTDEVFGSQNYGLSKESSTYKPSSPYSSSKAATDLVALSFNETYKTNIKIVNLCNNFGPYQYLEKFIPTCISKLVNNEKIPIYGKGINVREWIYVDDACEAISKLINSKTKQVRFNIGSNNRIDNFTIASKIYSILKKNNKTKLESKNFFHFVKDRPGHDLRYALDSSLFNKTFNFKIRNNLDKGLSKTVAWYLSNKEWTQYMKKKFVNKRVGLND